MSGRLGVAALAAEVNTVVYTAGASAVTVNVLMCNRGTEAAAVNVALVNGDAAALTDADYVEYGVSLPPNGVLERSGLVMSAGESVVVWSDKDTVSARVNGYTEE